MDHFPVDTAVGEIWKIYPVRIQGQSRSACHGLPTLLVQSMEGGYVTRNCPACGGKNTVPDAVFLEEIDLWVACPQCKERMGREIVEKNYSFVCRTCDIYIRLADLLPRWSDL